MAENVAQSVLVEFFNVFDAVGTWIADATSDMLGIFYGEGGLTFLGILAVAGLAFSVVFLIIGLIQRFLHFAG